MSDELGMDMEAMAAATEQFKAEMDTNPANVELSDINESFTEPLGSTEPEIELEDSNFWGNKQEEVEIPAELDVDPDAEIEVPEVGVSPSSEPFRYKANGEDVELDISSEVGLAQIRKALEREAGMDKAFSQSAKLQKQIKQLQSDMASQNKYKENWDKIEDLKHDRKALLELITGESYEDVMAKEVARKNAYDLGTEDERRIIDYEQRLQDVEVGHKRDKARAERLAIEASEAESRAFELNLRSSMEREFFKQTSGMKFEDAAMGNKVKEAIWTMATNDLKAYQTKYGKLTPKMYQKAFSDNAKMIGNQAQAQIDSGVSKAIENRKKSAKEKAQLSSTRNYGQSLADTDLASLPPDKLFQRMFKR